MPNFVTYMSGSNFYDNSVGAFFYNQYYWNGNNQYRPIYNYFIAYSPAYITFKTSIPMRFNRMYVISACYGVRVTLYLSYDEGVTFQYLGALENYSYRYSGYGYQNTFSPPRVGATYFQLRFDVVISWSYNECGGIQMYYDSYVDY